MERIYVVLSAGGLAGRRNTSLHWLSLSRYVMPYASAKRAHTLEDKSINYECPIEREAAILGLLIENFSFPQSSLDQLTRIRKNTSC